MAVESLLGGAVVTVVGAIAYVIKEYRAFRSASSDEEKREADTTDVIVSAADTVSRTAISLIEPLRGEINDLHKLIEEERERTKKIIDKMQTRINQLEDLLMDSENMRRELQRQLDNVTRGVL